MKKSRWMSHDCDTFRPGDIICRSGDQDFLRLVIKVDEDVIWCAGLVHAAFTEQADAHPVFPIYKNEIEDVWGGLTKLGNLDDYKEYVERVQDECIAKG